MLDSVKDEWLSARISKEFPALDPEKITVIKAVNNPYLEGKNSGTYGCFRAKDRSGCSEAGL